MKEFIRLDVVQGAEKAAREAYLVYGERDAEAPQRRNAPIG